MEGVRSTPVLARLQLSIAARREGPVAHRNLFEPDLPGRTRVRCELCDHLCVRSLIVPAFRVIALCGFGSDAGQLMYPIFAAEPMNSSHVPALRNEANVQYGARLRCRLCSPWASA